MSGEYGSQEILTQGPEQGLVHRRTGWRPGRARRLVTVLLVAGVGAAAWAGYALTGPRLPAVAVSEIPDYLGNMGEAQTPWQPGPTGRPAHGVELKVNVVFGPEQAKGKVTVLGMVGPGIVEGRGTPVTLAADRRTSATLVTDVDCTKVRLPVAPADYGLKVRVSDGSRQAEGTVPTGSMSNSWAASLETACASWLARRDLTVTKASAQVDALKPSADLVLTISNSGHRTAFLAINLSYSSLTVSAKEPGEIAVPAGGLATVHLHVDVGLCDMVPPPSSDAADVSWTSADYIGLVALVGAHASPLATGHAQPFLDGYGATGVVMAGGAASAVSDALHSACGDLDQYVTLVTPHGFHVEPATGVLSVRVQIDGTPSRVSYLQLVSDQAPADDTTAFTPLWTTTQTLIPDRTGQVTTTLRYRTPHGASACPSNGSWIPGFFVVAHVPVPGGVRTLRFLQFINPGDSPDAIAELCPS